MLFSDPAYNIAVASHRKLRLHDPRVVQQYISNLHLRLDHHNVFPRLEALQEVIKTSQWTTSSTQEYESLDNVITESMIAAENDLSRRITTTYQWSPRLKQAVQRLRYWQLRLRQVRNQPFAKNQLLKYREEGNISEEEHSLSGEQDIQKARQNAYQSLKDLQKQHQELRDTYLEDLAEAIVLDRSPNLADPALEAVKLERSEKQLKQLISREKMRRMHRKIGRALGKLGGTGLSRIDIPDASAVTEGSGDPDNPKSWKGPWKSITNPVEIAREVCKVNAKQYHQAHTTPLGSGHIGQLFGRRGDTSASDTLLGGTLPEDLPANTLPETIRILNTLATPVPSVDGEPIISSDDFRSTYRVAHEGTSSSPSGRHIGHYKAILKDPTLVQMHSQMMSIPFQVGFAPQCWTKVTDIMLEKEVNNPRCHRLRILALFESDLNHAKRIIIGHRLLHHMNDHSMIPQMQHGSVPGKHCLSAVLKKVFSHDYIRLTKTSGAFIENDAVGCYD